MTSKSGALVFVSWAEDCSRSDSIATRLGGISIKIYSKIWGSRYATIVFKYATQAFKTLLALRRHRATAIIVMTPPVVACFPVWLYAKLAGIRYAIDAHTGAFLDPRWKRLSALHRFFSRRATTTIVTSNHLADIVRQWGGHATVVPDVPVVFPAPKDPALDDARYHMTFVSSFTWDEPLDVFLAATRSLPEVRFYVTGRPPPERRESLAAAPPNVTFTGFVSRAEFTGLLLKSDAIISLTTLDHTMQRAAYEAIYLGKPVITSKFPLLEREFGLGTVHVANTVEDLIRGIRTMCEHLPTYVTGAKLLRETKLERWTRSESELRALLLRQQT